MVSGAGFYDLEPVVAYRPEDGEALRVPALPVDNDSDLTFIVMQNPDYEYAQLDVRMVAGTEAPSLALAHRGAGNYTDDIRCMLRRRGDCSLPATTIDQDNSVDVGHRKTLVMRAVDRSSQCKDGTAASPNDCIVRFTVSSHPGPMLTIHSKTIHPLRLDYL